MNEREAADGARRNGDGAHDGGATAPARPTVSAVICTVDRPQLLRAAIASIVAQRYGGVVETIVVYDGTDPDESLNSDDPMRPVSVIPNTHRQGLPAGRNCGAEAATGEFLGFCDDDDTWLSDKAAAQVAQLEAHPEVDAVVCGMEVDHQGEVIARPLHTDAVTFGDLLDDRVMEVEFVTTMVRRAAFLDPERLGGADEAIPGGYAEDYEFVLRAARRHPLPTIRRPLVRKGWGGGSLFAERWQMINTALAYLNDRVPEFAHHPRGHARILGQRAFATAAAGDRRSARALIAETLRADWRQPRGWLAVGVWARLVPANRVVAALNRRGRGL
jgi:glycosyltransferase involved in cell wall biosynthesis